MKQTYHNIMTPVEELATLVYHHFGKLPMGWTGIDKLTEYAHNEQFVLKVFDLYTNLKNRNDLFLGINPSQYYKIIYKFQLASKELDIDIKKISDCYFFLANYAVKSYNAKYDNIKDSISKIEFNQISDTRLTKKISYLSGLLRSFSETVYCDEHTISGEIFAPIYVDEKLFIAKQYMLINANEIQPLLQDCPYKNINVITGHKDYKLEVKTDIVGNLITKGTPNKYIDSFYIEYLDKDDNLVIVNDEKIIDEIINYFEKIIPSLVSDYKNKSLEERLWKKIECEYYAMSNLFKSINEKWNPIKYHLDISLISNINRPIVKANEEITNESNNDEIMKKLIELMDY